MKDENRVKISIFAAAAFAALLLAGCQSGKERRSSQKGKDSYEYVPIDTAAMDEEFYRRMRELDALFPDIPSDK